MSIRLFKLIILSTLVVLSAHINVSAQSDVQRLVEALQAPSPIIDDLQELCDIGGRVTGSKQNEKSVKWALKKFKKAKVNAEADPFEMPVLWLGKRSTALVSGGIDLVPDLVAKYQAPPGYYEAELVYFKEFYADVLFMESADIKGKFLIVDMDLCLDINGLFAEYKRATEIEDLARIYEVAGIIFMSSRPNKLLYRYITSRAIEEDLPQFVMARHDAKKIITAVESGEKTTIGISVEAKTGPSFVSNNVIAEITGSKYPEEVIVIGSHLDSWALGDGANDNACNVSLMIDIARQMKALDIQPERTIRFALWNGEEQGYFGSWDYTKDHLDELENHKMALSIDIGSGAITGFFMNGRDSLSAIIDSALLEVADLGPFSHLANPIVGTDNFDFMLQGVPNLVGIHKAQLYGPNYHASSDNFDKVDTEQLKKNAAIVGALTLSFANMEDEENLLRQQERAEIQAIFDRFDLEFTMRMFNVWDPWANGSRGRQ